MRGAAARLARSLESATGEGGRPDLTGRISALRPLPDRREPQG